jgi:PAS domain S-box-containing protein
MTNPKPSEKPRPQLRIIHLEDNLLDRDLVAAMLEGNGIECEIVYADDRDTFRAVLAGEAADLIISDFSLPGYDGGKALELARQMREEVPFIFFSGTLGEEAAVESLKNGATDYILKQRPERLVAAVRRALKDAAARAAREKMVDELRQRDGLLRNIIENVEDLVSVVDLDGRLILSSPSHRKLFGMATPAMGTDFLTHVHPSDRARIKAIFLQVIEEDSRPPVEYRLLFPDGSVRFLEARGKIMFDESGGKQGVLWVARDITERRLAGQQILEQAALLDEARDAICVNDLDQRILFWNKSAERLYGWTSNEAIGRNANQLLGQDQVALMALKTLIQRGEWNGELHQSTRAGSHVVVASRWTLMRDEAGAPKSILVINTDITEQKKIEAQFLRTQRMDSIGALAGGIAHDLNNVLGPIMMAVEVIQRDPQNIGNAGLLELVGNSARRGSELVKQILSFARGIDGQKTVLKIPQLVTEIVKLASDTFPRDISVRSKVADDLPRVEGDATQLHQILLNLFVNARDAMPNGGSISVEVRTVAVDHHSTKFHREPLSGSFVEISVADTGTGIAADVLPKIFEPFFTTKDPGKGTGLGLSTVLGIVKAHAGFVEVASEPGKSTKFFVYLPVTAMVPVVAEREGAVESMHGHNEQILVVDDETAILEITRATLAAFNYRVWASSSGDAAIPLYAQRHAEIDLVITDILMPGMDGSALIDAMRKIKPDVRLIAVSGIASAAKDLDCGFLKKPYSTTALLKMVRSALDS